MQLKNSHTLYKKEDKKMWQEVDPVEIGEVLKKIRSVVSLLMIASDKDCGNVPTLESVHYTAMTLWDTLIDIEDMFEKFSSEADGLRHNYNDLKRIMNEANTEQTPEI